MRYSGKFQLESQPTPTQRSEDCLENDRERDRTSKFGRVADIYFAPKTLMITFPTICTGADPAIGIEGRLEAKWEEEEEDGVAHEGGFLPNALPAVVRRREGETGSPGYQGELSLLPPEDLLSFDFWIS